MYALILAIFIILQYFKSLYYVDINDTVCFIFYKIVGSFGSQRNILLSFTIYALHYGILKNNKFLMCILYLQYTYYLLLVQYLLNLQRIHDKVWFEAHYVVYTSIRFSIRDSLSSPCVSRLAYVSCIFSVIVAHAGKIAYKKATIKVA